MKRFPVLGHSNFWNKKITKVAVLGGSGSFANTAAMSANADVFVTFQI